MHQSPAFSRSVNNLQSSEGFCLEMQIMTAAESIKEKQSASIGVFNIAVHDIV